jgi:hypothetical protein
MFESTIPGAAYGAQQFGPQQFGHQGFYGSHQGFHSNPFLQPGQIGIPGQSQLGGYGYPFQSVLPLTIGQGPVPFQQQQLQPPQLQLIPVATPQGVIGQWVLVGGFVTPQIPMSPWSAGSIGYGVPQYGVPQYGQSLIGPQSQIGGLGGGYLPLQAQQQIPQQLYQSHPQQSYLPQSYLPQSLVPQAYLPFTPFGVMPTPTSNPNLVSGQPIATGVTH